MALSPTDAWAVGVAHGGSGTIPLPEGPHRDRTGAAADRALGWNEVVGLAIAPGRRGSLIGLQSNPLLTVRQFRMIAIAVAERWDGHRWSLVSTPSMGGDGFVRSVAALSANDAWAVGNGTEGFESQARVLHWGGRRWSAAAACEFPTFADPGSGVAALPDDSVWVVGSVDVSSTTHYRVETVIQHLEG